MKTPKEIATTDEFTREEKEGLLSRAVHECEIGTLGRPDTGLLTFLGTARFNDDVFELYIQSTADGAVPTICHEATGHYFSLPWIDMIRLAVARDIRLTS